MGWTGQHALPTAAASQPAIAQAGRAAAIVAAAIAAAANTGNTLAVWT